MAASVASPAHDLIDVISQSPVEVDPRLFHMVRRSAGFVPSESGIPEFVMSDAEETTTVSAQTPDDYISTVDAYRDLRLLKLRGSKPFAAPGLINAATAAIAARHHSVLVISTFSVDYILVRAEALEECLDALAHAGFPVANPDA